MLLEEITEPHFLTSWSE